MSTRSQVTSLYRRALKLSLDWTIHRNLWRGQAMYLRDLFEANKHVSDPRQQKVIIKQTEDLLEKWKHPDPYRAPTAPGGSKYERNLPAHVLEPPTEEDTKHLYEGPTLPADLQAFLQTTTSEELRRLAESGEKVAIPGVKGTFIQRSEQKEATAH